MWRLYTCTLCSKTLSPLWNINLWQVSSLCFPDMSLFKPFLDLTVFANQNRVQFGLFVFPLYNQICIHTKCFRCLNRVLKVLPDKLLIIWCSIYDRTIFRRIRWCRNVTLLVFTPIKCFIPKVGHFSHRRIKFLQIRDISCIQIILIGIKQRPRGANRIPACSIVFLSHACKHIRGAETTHKPAIFFSWFTLDAKRRSSSSTSGLSQNFQIIIIRDQTFTQVACHSRPVIHLHIDVKMIVSIPHKRSFSPNTLKIGRESPFSWTCNRQITSKLIADNL